MKKILAFLFLIVSVMSFASDKVLMNEKVKGKKPALKVMTYNIAAGANNFKVDLKKTAEAIKAIDADIIGIQEVDRLTNRSGKVDQAQVLANLTGYNLVFGKTIDFDGGEYGIAILSKHKIESHYQINLPGGDEQRIALIAKVEVPGFEVPITYINTHLDWHENPEVRMGQIYAIDEHTLDLRGIKILGGDFNDTLNSEVIKHLHRYWTPVISKKHDYRTWPAVNPEVGLDYIFTNHAQKWEVETYIPNTDKAMKKDGIEWNKVSDHIPVVTVLKLIEK